MVKIVQPDAGMVGTGADTFTAADTKIAVVIHNAPGAVVAHLRGTNHDTAVAINAFVFQYMNNRPQILCFHQCFLS
jgi:hypothetical protein